MAYQEEEQVKLKRWGSRQAIALAMQGRWREAVVANKNIIENFPNDVDAYNRLGRAHMELGEYSLAKEAYSRAMELDPYNTIAKKNLHRLADLEGVATLEGAYRKIEPQHFIEEAGKAGIVALHNIALRKIRAKMVAGDRVYLKVDEPNLIAQSGQGEYLGQVEPKHGQRLMKLMKGGNKYTAVVVSSTEEAMSIIIREVYQDPSQMGHLSFPSRGFKRIRPYISDRIVRRHLEEETGAEELGYTIVGGDDMELLPEESSDIEDEDEDEDENEEQEA